MIDEIAQMQMEYDGLLLRLSAGEIDPCSDEAHRIQVIENNIARQFGFDWMQTYLKN